MAASDGDLEKTSSGGSRPVPDPTELTDKAIAKAVVLLTQYVDGKIDALNERLRASDVATDLRLKAIDGIPVRITAEVGHLEQLHDQKFDAVQIQFKERDTRAERESRDNKVAVDAAFAAQKEAAAKQDESNAKAIDKSEKATAETIKTNQELTRATSDNLTKDVDSLKLAVGRIESTKLGIAEQRTTQTTDRTSLYATIGLIVTIILATIAIIGALRI